MQGTMPGARRRGRPRTAWIDNIKTWTGLSVEESVRMTEDRRKLRKYVHGVAMVWPTLGSRTAKEQNSNGFGPALTTVPYFVNFRCCALHQVMFWHNETYTDNCNHDVLMVTEFDTLAALANSAYNVVTDGRSC